MKKSVTHVAPIVVLLVLLLFQADAWAWSPTFQDVTENNMATALRGWATAIVGGLAAVFSVVLIGSLLWLSKKLSVGAGNPEARAQAIGGFLWVFVAGLVGFASSTIAGIALWLSRQ